MGLSLPLCDRPECQKRVRLLPDLLARNQLQDAHSRPKVQEGLREKVQRKALQEHDWSLLKTEE